MWRLASAHGTSSPFIQIFSVGVMGMVCFSPRSTALDAGGDRVADVGCRAGERGGIRARLSDAGGGVGLAEKVEHHRCAQDGGYRIGLAGTDDVRGRPGRWVEHAPG